MRWWLIAMLGACSYTPPAELGGDDDEQLPPDAPPGPDAPANLICPAMFDSFGGTTFYRIINDQNAGKPWKASEMECANFGAGIHLAVVDNAAEADAIAEHLVINRQYWVGMFQLRGEHDKADDWKWITGGDGIDHWASGEPNDGDDGPSPIVMNENDSDQFAVMNGTGELNDRKETDMRPAICECDGVPVDASLMIP